MCRSIPVLTALLCLSACGDVQPPKAEEASTEPAPPGAAVGATGADATAAPAAPGDTSARTGSHP